LSINRTTSEDPGFEILIRQLNAYLAELNGEKDPFYSALNKVDGIPTVVLAFADGEPVGCGAFRPIDEKTVEIKRMFVLPEFRGKGIASSVLAELESWAKEKGASCAVLETGSTMTSAIRLYEKAGYKRTENYGPYVGNEGSACFSKALA